MEYTNVEYPQHIYDIKEIAALSKAIDIEMEKLGLEIDALEADFAIETSTERGIARREAFLGITPFDTDSLEVRRTNVATRYNDRALYTERYLRRALDKMLGHEFYTLQIDYSNNNLVFRCSLNEKRKYKTARDLIERIVPLHIKVDSDLKYNKWAEIGERDWEEVGQKTWDHWKSDVL